MFRWPVLLGLVVAAFVLLSVTELGGLAFLLLIVLLIALGAARPPWWVFLLPLAFPVYAAVAWQIDPDEGNDTIDDAGGAALLTFAFGTLPAAGLLLLGLLCSLAVVAARRRLS